MNSATNTTHRSGNVIHLKLSRAKKKRLAGLPLVFSEAPQNEVFEVVKELLVFSAKGGLKGLVFAFNHEGVNNVGFVGKDSEGLLAHAASVLSDQCDKKIRDSSLSLVVGGRN